MVPLSPVETVPDYAGNLPVRASATTALSGSNNDVRARWLVPGTVGNGKTLAGTFSGSYSVVGVALVGSSPVTGFAITGPVGTTANQVIAAANANAAVMELTLPWEAASGNTGAGAMVTFSSINFAGGSGTIPDAPVATIP